MVFGKITFRYSTYSHNYSLGVVLDLVAFLHFIESILESYYPNQFSVLHLKEDYICSFFLELSEYYPIKVLPCHFES